MTAVLLHEGTHVLQFQTYGRRMSQLVASNKLPDSFNDDSIQEQFGTNEAFAASVARETELLAAAGAAPDVAEGKRLARQAMDVMKARHKRWYVGEHSYLREAEDIWLTLEGSAQWVGYRWLIDPKGAALSPKVAQQAFGLRGKWWSQRQGFALFLAIDRIGGPQWRRHAFGDGARTGMELLQASLAADPS